MISVLKGSKLWLVDEAFELSLKIFYQIYTFRFKNFLQYFSCLFTLFFEAKRKKNLNLKEKGSRREVDMHKFTIHFLALMSVCIYCLFELMCVYVLI